MIKAYAALILLSMMIIAAQGQDYLEGGYVRSGSYGDTRQYFTDPIFYPQGSGGYASSDPAIRQMQESMDRSRYSAAAGRVTANPIGSSATSSGIQPITTQVATPTTTPKTAVVRWHLELSDGKLIDLDLHQSGSRVFGLGNMVSGAAAQWVTASGSITGSSLMLDVMPASGTELYTITLDTSKLHLPGLYTVFRADAQPGSGNVKANISKTGIPGALGSGIKTKHDMAKNAIGNVR